MGVKQCVKLLKGKRLEWVLGCASVCDFLHAQRYSDVRVCSVCGRRVRGRWRIRVFYSPVPEPWTGHVIHRNTLNDPS